MKHLSTFMLFEYEKYAEFDGALKFGDWSEFAEKLDVVMSEGFDDASDLITKLGMDPEMYESVRKNLVYNWQDSVSKSLLHGVSGVDLEIPSEGDVIFRSPIEQTRFLIVCGPGMSSQNIMGLDNKTEGLRMWGFPSMINVETGKSAFARFENNAKYTLSSQRFDELNLALQYVWVYIFYNDYLLKSRKPKLPKALYRGIRINNLYQYPAVKELWDEARSNVPEEVNNKEKNDWVCSQVMRGVMDLIANKGLGVVSEGKYLSFTSNEAVARYFANSEGFLIKVDPSKVRIVTSPLTDEYFDEYNSMSNRKESEYVVALPDDYEFKPEDFLPSSLEMYAGEKSPLMVQYLNTSYTTTKYDMTDLDGHEYSIKAYFSWNSNGIGGKVEFWIEGYQNGFGSRTQIKKQMGFDPMPNEKNLDSIKNFKVIYK